MIEKSSGKEADMFRRKRDKRYEARPLDWRPILDVETGVVDDTEPDKPSKLDKTGPGFEYVTTYSNAKRIARRANRKDS